MLNTELTARIKEITQALPPVEHSDGYHPEDTIFTPGPHSTLEGVAANVFQYLEDAYTELAFALGYLETLKATHDALVTNPALSPGEALAGVITAQDEAHTAVYRATNPNWAADLSEVF